MHLKNLCNWLLPLSLLILNLGLISCSSSDDTPAVESLKIVSVTNQGLFDYQGGILKVEVSASSTPTVYNRSTWVGQPELSASGNKYTYTMTVAKNEGTPRTERISFVVGSLSETIEVRQSGAPVESYQPAPMMALGLGWNLGNQFDANNNGVANETAWGNPATTQALFDHLAADGMRTVRIPVTWLGHVGDAPDYKIDATWLDRIFQVVGFAQKAGLNVIINIHHDGYDTGRWLDVARAAKDAEFKSQMFAQFTAMWTQIATKFVDKGEFLIFEPFNELHDGSWGWGENRKDGGKQYAVINELNQAFVDAVRATGSNNATRWLSAVGYTSNPDLTLENLQLPKDSANGRLMVAVHYYDPTTFTLEGTKTDWGHTGKAANKESWGNEDDITKTFAKLRDKYEPLGIPVYIGEGGCIHHSTDRGETFRKYYLEYVARAAREAGIGFIIWDNGSASAGHECHGYYNHGTGKYLNNSEEIIKILTKAYYTDDPGYSLQTIYDAAPNL